VMNRQLLPRVDSSPPLRRSSIIRVSSAMSGAPQKHSKNVSARSLKLSPFIFRHRPDQQTGQRDAVSTAHPYSSHTVRKLLCSPCRAAARHSVAIQGRCYQWNRWLYLSSTASSLLPSDSERINLRPALVDSVATAVLVDSALPLYQLHVYAYQGNFSPSKARN
jgi:hypothetical protein